MRWRIVALVPALVTAFMIAAGGCGMSPVDQGRCSNEDGCAPNQTATQPVCADLCVEKPDAGFTGPHWFWLGSPADMPLCPKEAPFDGVRAYADASPDVEPPCAAAQNVKWGFVARECKIKTEETCELAGETCVPTPPEGYSLCIYQDDEAECPPAYPTRHRLLRENPDQVCSGMGVEAITLCCAVPQVPA